MCIRLAAATIFLVWMPLAATSLALGASAGQAPAGPSPQPRSLHFSLQRFGDVLRIRWIHEQRGRTEAVAIAFQLTGTNPSRQKFKLQVYGDSTSRHKKSFKAGQPIVFEARGTPQPYEVRVSKVDRLWISGEVVQTDPKARIDIDLYSRDFRFQKDGPNARWHPDAKPTPAFPFGQAIREPEVLRSRIPMYTGAAIKARVEGLVLVRVVVRKDGSVDFDEVLISAGFFGLDESVIESITNDWQFRPAMLDGKPIDFQLTIKVIFSMF